MDRIDLTNRARDLAQHWIDEGDEDTLEFFGAAIACGADEETAEDIATQLNERVMRARGAI